MLTLPPELTALIESGVWPTPNNVQQQNLHSIVPESVIRSFAPEESKLYLYPPPFTTIRKSIGDSWWSNPMSTLSELDPDRTMLIGDFGLGSDAPLALDFRRSISEPSVIRLKWANEGNHWVEVTPTFKEFAAIICRNYIDRCDSRLSAE
jgi:hypothetical protein